MKDFRIKMEYHGNCEDGLVLWEKECSEGSRGQGPIAGNAHSEERQRTAAVAKGRRQGTLGSGL